MDKKNGETQVRQNDANNSGSYERGLKVLARIIARRHIRNQLNEIEGRTHKKSINHANDNKSSNG